MAVLQMQRISICALKKDRKKVLELIQRCGVIEISDVSEEDNVLQKTDVTTAVGLLEKNVQTARNALGILDHYAETKKSGLDMLNGRVEVSSKDYDEFYPRHDKTVQAANHIVKLEKEIAENKAEISRLETQMETLAPWQGLDIPLNYKGTKDSAVFTGVLPGEWNQELIYEKLGAEYPLHLDIISASKDQTCIFLLCLKKDSESLMEALRAIGFSMPSVSKKYPPAELINQLKGKIEEAGKEITEAEQKIVEFKDMRDELLFLTDYDTMRTEKYTVIGSLLQSKSVFLLSGYIPKKATSGLEKVLNEKFELFVECEDVAEDEEVPVLLQNNGFSGPLESVVESYSMPGKGEIDPSMVMSLFYYVLFGLMLSDAGYGALIAIACGVVLLKFKNLDDSMKKTMKMFLYCGISTIFWGIMFGSYFGDVVDVVSETFIGRKVSIPPVWFFPVQEPMRMLTFSMLLGLIHIYAGLAVKLYTLIKQKLYKDALYDVVSWYALLTSCVLLLLSSDMFAKILGLSFKLPAIVGTVSSVLALVSAVVIVLTNGRESRNPFKRFLKGLYALYGISGYLSDVLSYSRLLALGLATGVIASVINKMGSMVGNSIPGLIVFILAFLVGHALNLAINALGSYVHTNRLQYVEFFGKFYEGNGRKFKPFSVKTKYYKFKENTYHE